MCLTSETVDELHAVTTALKEEQIRRAIWLGDYDDRDGGDGSNGCIPMNVTRAEAERIFADRIAAHEAKLKDLGWSRTIRVEPAMQKDGTP